VHLKNKKEKPKMSTKRKVHRIKRRMVKQGFQAELTAFQNSTKKKNTPLRGNK
jgi:hypothetical protein